MVAHLSSDIFVDLDEDGTYTEGEFLWGSGQTNTEYDVIFEGWSSWFRDLELEVLNEQDIL